MADSGPADADDERHRPARAATGLGAGLDAARARATAAGALFAVAAAACLLAVASQGGRVAAGRSFEVLVGTGVAYGLAVACFLVAAVIAPPRPLTYLMLAGTALGVVAVLGTVATTVLAVTDQRAESVEVYVRQDTVLHDLRHSCAGLPHPFPARLDLEELDQPVVHIEVTCKDGTMTFVLPVDDVFVVTP